MVIQKTCGTLELFVTSAVQPWAGPTMSKYRALLSRGRTTGPIHATPPSPLRLRHLVGGIPPPLAHPLEHDQATTRPLP